MKFFNKLFLFLLFLASAMLLTSCAADADVDPVKDAAAQTRDQAKVDQNEVWREEMEVQKEETEIQNEKTAVHKEDIEVQEDQISNVPQEGNTDSKKTDDTVYVTESGEKFHRDSCRHLKDSKFAVSRSDAISKGYEACGTCKP